MFQVLRARSYRNPQAIMNEFALMPSNRPELSILTSLAVVLALLIAWPSNVLAAVDGNHAKNNLNSSSLATHARMSNGASDKCHQYQSECQPLQSSTCLDVTLSYRYTALTGEFRTQQEVHDHLSKWTVLKKIPRCWIALQPLLCTLFLPRCENNLTYLPTAEMCRIAQGPCRLVETEYAEFWPHFLKCENATIFPSNCPNQYKDLKFSGNISTAGKCPHPLVPTDDSAIWFSGIDGCAFPCANTLYSPEETSRVSSFIYYGCLVTLIANIFTALTFVIDWKNSNRYPAVIIFYLSICIIGSTLGWLFQFTFGKNDLVCRADNTTRHGEPSENSLCLLNFAVIYYFTIAALAWFVNLAFAFDISFRRQAFKDRESTSKTTSFHLAAWSIPLLLLITVVAIGEVSSCRTNRIAAAVTGPFCRCV